MRPARCPAAPTDCPAARVGIDPGRERPSRPGRGPDGARGLPLHADTDTVEQLTGYPRGRPDDPPGRPGWVADLLGQHAATLRRLDAAATSAYTPIGEPS